MKKVFKRVIVTTLALCIFLGIPAYADENLTSDQMNTKEYKEIYTEILTENMAQEEFVLFLKDDKKAAMSMIDRLADEAYFEEYIPQPKGGSGYIAYCYVTTVEQCENNYCAYATMMQTFYGIGIEDDVDGFDDDAKQETLASDMGTLGSSPLVYQVTNELNDYVSSNQYEYILGSSKTQMQFASECYDSLINDRPVLLHALTGPLSYYNGINLGHYLSLDKINMYYAEVRIVDCNYNPTYQGVHTDVALSEAYDTIDSNNRYFICD